MKLLTHNMLTSNIIKGVTKGYPLKIECQQIEIVETEFNKEFLEKMIPKIDYGVLCRAADQIGHLGDLPKVLPETSDYNEEFMKELHRVLLKVEIKEGNLVCPETGRKFPVSNGIPNMLLNEEEV
ncbi:DgyrCDS4984 [Dimorphilus gyrociliatus]|uniref:Multifunctional methyltransferase subunit TRM112-like protein n=1 Tax=Dimorphilus gyrociliatus TaxID=2664684 RepID=A0A7I8VIB6_9ANNE|nr:DgyrCDS4984 [Dimorphilus gyrociliatus]